MTAMRRMLGTVVLAAAASMVGCAAKNKAPAWVSDPASRLDPSTYFMAIGDGPSLGGAEREAKQDLVRQVAEATDHEPTDASEYVRRVEQAGGRPEVTAELLELKDLDAAAPLVGLQIVERWSDPKRGRYVVLGAISRPLLVSAYETEMRLNSALADRLAARAEGETVTLRKFAMLRTALVAAEAYNELRFARGRLAGALSGYDPTLDPPDASESELREEIAALRATVAASIESVGQDQVPVVIETEVKSALQRLNVPVKTDESEGNVRILVGFNVIPVNETARDARLVNWRLSVEVVEDSTGRSLATLGLDGKTGGKTVADARTEAARLARVELREKIDEFLNRTLFEQALNTD